MNFKVVLCPKCARYQVTSAKKSLKCKYCNKSTVFKKSNSVYRQIIVKGVFEDPMQASQYCRKIKEIQNEN